MDLTKSSVRKALTPRREPYWHRLRTGLFLGYRALAQGEGTWIGRYRNDAGKQEYRSFGYVESFDKASLAVREWGDSLAQGVNSEGRTVAQAYHRYLDRLELEKGADARYTAERVYLNHVVDTPIGRTPLDKLRKAHVQAWRDDMVDASLEGDALRKNKATVNRRLTYFKAALNQAKADGLIATDVAWIGVTHFPGVEQSRGVYVPLDDRKKLVSAAGKHIGAYIQALLYTGARPGEIAKLNVSDVDATVGTLTLTGKTGRRTITLAGDARKFFIDLATDRPGNAPLLVNDYDQRWTANVWNIAFRIAAGIAGLDREVVAYALRHSVITDWIVAGVDVLTVARVTGTSVTMIQKNYGHLISGHAEKLAAVPTF